MSATRQKVINEILSLREWLSNKYLFDDDATENEIYDELIQRKRLIDNITEFSEYLESIQKRNYIRELQERCDEISDVDDFIGLVNKFV